MSRSTPILALGIVFALSGLALFAFAMRKKDEAPSAKPVRKSDLRDIEIEQKNNVKMRIAGGILAAFGAVLVLIS